MATAPAPESPPADAHGAPADAHGAHAAPGGKGKKPKILIIIIGGVVLGGAALGGKMMFSKGPASPHGDEAHAENTTEHEAEPAPDLHKPSKIQPKASTFIIPFKQIVVPVHSAEGSTRWKLRASLSLETKSKDLVDLVNGHQEEPLYAKLKDFMISKLMNVEIAEIDREAGRNHLKSEIRKGFNEILEEEKIEGTVDKVYFTDFFIGQ